MRHQSRDRTPAAARTSRYDAPRCDREEREDGGDLPISLGCGIQAARRSHPARCLIVFTHDLVFLSEVRFYAAKDQTPLRVLGIRRGAYGFGSLDPDGEPWLTKHLPGRRQWLTEQLGRLKKLHAAASEDYEVQLRFFYDRLRESWEKFIEEKLFAQVIARFQPQVQTLRLKEAFVD